MQYQVLSVRWWGYVQTNAFLGSGTFMKVRRRLGLDAPVLSLDEMEFPAAFLCTSIVLTAAVGAGTSLLSSLKDYVPCADVTVLNDASFVSLSKHSQQLIRYAVRPSVQAIVDDPGMGMAGTVVDAVPLSAVQVSRGTTANALYVVSWDDRSFGANGAIWIVDVTPAGARNLVRLRRDQSPTYSLSGYGFEVLSSKAELYPEIMIASKGFKADGGAQAENVCLGKTGEYYESVACPATCHNTLNSR